MWLPLPDGEKKINIRFLKEYTNVTGRQTDGRTDRRTDRRTPHDGISRAYAQLKINQIKQEYGRWLSAAYSRHSLTHSLLRLTS